MLHLHTNQGHLTNPLLWATQWTSWRKYTLDGQHKNMASKGTRCLPVTDKSLIFLLAFAQQPPYTYCYTHKHTFTLSPVRPTPSQLSAHAVCLRRLMVIPSDPGVWRTSAIRLHYDQGYPGTCLLLWNDVACHWSKWQLDGCVSSTNTHHTHY